MKPISISNNNFLSKIFYNFPFKRLTPLFVLGMIDAVSFLLAFYIKNVFPDLPRRIGINEDQYSSLQMMYGLFSLLFYFPGGWLADKFSNKKIIIWSLILTIVGAVIFAILPLLNSDNFVKGKGLGLKISSKNSLITLYIIHAIWGISTSGLLWASLWRFVSLQGSPKEQGKVNAIEGSICGLVGALSAIPGYFFIKYLFTKLSIKYFVEKEMLGFFVFYFYLIILGLIGLFLFIFMIDDIKKSEKKIIKEKVPAPSSIWRLLKNKNLLLVSFLVMAVYVYQSALSVFGYYLQNSLYMRNFSLITSGIIFVVLVTRTYIMRTICSPIAGRIADRYRNYILAISILLFICVFLGILAIILPGFNHQHKTIDDYNYSTVWKNLIQVVAILIDLLIAAICWCSVTIRWATINQIKIDPRDYGKAVGFVSLVAFSTDVWFWQITSLIQKAYQFDINKYLKNKGVEGIPDKESLVASLFGNQLIFIIISFIGLMGAIVGLYLHFNLRKQNVLLKKNSK